MLALCMLPHLRLLPSFCATVLSSLLSGCCLDTPCDGGFTWYATPASGIIEPGVYHFTITVEHDSIYELECEVDSASNPIDCEQWRNVENSDFEVHLSPGLLSETLEGDPPSGFVILIAAYDGKNTVGPRQVTIKLTRDAALLADIDYEVEYTRDYEYNGGRHCGFCDRGADLQMYEWQQ